MDHLDKVNGILMEDEKIASVATQKFFSPPMNINWSPDSVVLTNKRFIVFHPRLFGGSPSTTGSGGRCAMPS